MADDRKEVLIRSGKQSIPAPAHILQNLILKGKNITFDSLPSEYNVGDLSFTLLIATIKDKAGKKFDKNRDYIFLGLADKNNKLTNGGVLLNDQGPLNQSKVVCTRWNGLRNGSIKEDVLDDKLFTREDVKGFFNVKNSRASEIIAILLNSKMIENPEGSKYKFIR